MHFQCTVGCSTTRSLQHAGHNLLLATAEERGMGLGVTQQAEFDIPSRFRFGS